MIMIIMIMMMTIKMKMIRRKWWASDSDKCEGRSVACPPLSRVYCTLPCIFHFTSLYFCACTFLYFLCLTFLFILQMFFPTFVNCTRLMYLHCTFISMSLSLSDKVRLKKYVKKWIYFQLKKNVTKVRIEHFLVGPSLSVSAFPPLSLLLGAMLSAECWVLSTEYCWVLCWPLNSTIVL